MPGRLRALRPVADAASRARPGDHARHTMQVRAPHCLLRPRVQRRRRRVALERRAVHVHPARRQPHSRGPRLDPRDRRRRRSTSGRSPARPMSRREPQPQRPRQCTPSECGSLACACSYCGHLIVRWNGYERARIPLYAAEPRAASNIAAITFPEVRSGTLSIETELSWRAPDGVVRRRGLPAAQLSRDVMIGR